MATPITKQSPALDFEEYIEPVIDIDEKDALQDLETLTESDDECLLAFEAACLSETSVNDLESGSDHGVDNHNRDNVNVSVNELNDGSLLSQSDTDNTNKSTRKTKKNQTVNEVPVECMKQNTGGNRKLKRINKKKAEVSEEQQNRKRK
jgi:hypothetical protein